MVGLTFHLVFLVNYEVRCTTCACLTEGKKGIDREMVTTRRHSCS